MITSLCYLNNASLLTLSNKNRNKVSSLKNKNKHAVHIPMLLLKVEFTAMLEMLSNAENAQQY